MYVTCAFSNTPVASRALMQYANPIVVYVSLLDKRYTPCKVKLRFYMRKKNKELCGLATEMINLTKNPIVCVINLSSLGCPRLHLYHTTKLPICPIELHRVKINPKKF